MSFLDSLTKDIILYQNLGKEQRHGYVVAFSLEEEKADEHLAR